MSKEKTKSNYIMLINENRNLIIVVFIVVIILALIINGLLYVDIPTPLGVSNSDWLAFWGSIVGCTIGGIVGGIVAYKIMKHQLNSEKTFKK